MWDPVGTQNFLRVPSSRISALCLPPSLVTPTDADCAQNKASQFEAQSDLRVPSMSQAALEDIIMTDAGDAPHC